MAFSAIADQAPVVLAYLDPGTGSLMLQMLIAGLLSGMFFMKSSMVTLRASMSRLFNKNHA
jgi:hypothetical protein